MRKITPKQQAFASAYIDPNSKGFGNAAESYRMAYASKSTPAYCSMEGQKLLKHPFIRPLIAAARNPIAVKAEQVAAQIEQNIDISGITRERLIREMARLAFSDPRKMFRPDGTMVPIHELDDDTAATIAGFEVKTVEGVGENPADADDEEEFEARRGKTELRVMSIRRVKAWDKTKAGELLAKLAGWLKDEPGANGALTAAQQAQRDVFRDWMRDELAKRAHPAPALENEEQKKGPAPKGTGPKLGGNG